MLKQHLNLTKEEKDELIKLAKSHGFISADSHYLVYEAYLLGKENQAKLASLNK